MKTGNFSKSRHSMTEEEQAMANTTIGIRLCDAGKDGESRQDSRKEAVNA